MSLSLKHSYLSSISCHVFPSDLNSFSRCLWYFIIFVLLFLANFIHWNKKCSFPLFSTSLPINWAILFYLRRQIGRIFPFLFMILSHQVWQGMFFSHLARNKRKKRSVAFNTTSPVVLFDHKTVNSKRKKTILRWNKYVSVQLNETTCYDYVTEK